MSGCPSTKDGAECVRRSPHGPTAQHRSAAGLRWYYGDDMQRGMPRRYIHDRTPLIDLVVREAVAQVCAGSVTDVTDKSLDVQ